MIPMAIFLGWGVVFATVITLILVLVNALILDDLKRLFRAYRSWLTNTKKPLSPNVWTRNRSLATRRLP